MAQLSGTAARSISHTPAAFVAGVLLATTLMATAIILALAVGIDVKVRDGAAAAQHGVSAPNVVVSAPRAGVSPDDGRLDPIERGYIFRRGTSIGLPPQNAPDAPAVGVGMPRYQLVPR
jgi:hypothetical protein